MPLSPTRPSRHSLHRSSLLLAALLLWFAAGCGGDRYLSLRKAPSTPLADPLGLFEASGPSPTPRTVQLLRRLDIGEPTSSGDHIAKLDELEKRIAEQRTPEKIYSYAELAFIIGNQQEKKGDHKAALDYLARAISNTYQYLFDPEFDARRNRYDPQFRMACDVYNSALESAIRILHKTGQFRPGGAVKIHSGGDTYHIDFVLRGPWNPEEIESIDFVSNYELKGLKNHYHTYGLGVPLILLRKAPPSQRPSDRFYPPSLSFPATAFVHVMPGAASSTTPSSVLHCRLEIVDPLATTDLIVRERRVPLETDLSIPLAHCLDQPAMREKELATTGLINPAAAEPAKGLYMMEPFDPQKIPVVMVHGLWSSPMTWMEMYNDLRALPEIRERYQFWFYLYPTGQPFWISAAQFRADLANALDTLDAREQYPALRKMVLVGHSMGGLVSKMQTVYSDDRFWNLVSDHPFEELKAPEEIKERLRTAVFFEPNPAVHRLITIGTPHRGSHFANDYTRWLSRYFIQLPGKVLTTSQTLLTNNPGFFRSTELLTTNTSIDSLSPKSPVLQELLNARKAEWVSYHNIIGVVEGNSLIARVTAEGDGVVTVHSAHLDDLDSEEVRVTADHVTVHRHPRSVLEVYRILSDHADQFGSPYRGVETRRLSSRPNSSAATSRISDLEPDASRVHGPMPR